MYLLRQGTWVNLDRGGRIYYNRELDVSAPDFYIVSYCLIMSMIDVSGPSSLS